MQRSFQTPPISSGGRSSVGEGGGRGTGSEGVGGLELQSSWDI